jgi:hypothetical protein
VRELLARLWTGLETPESQKKAIMREEEKVQFGW